MLVFFSSGQFWLSDGNFFLGKFTQIKGTVRVISFYLKDLSELDINIFVCFNCILFLYAGSLRQ